MGKVKIKPEDTSCPSFYRDSDPDDYEPTHDDSIDGYPVPWFGQEVVTLDSAKAFMDLMMRQNLRLSMYSKEGLPEDQFCRTLADRYSAAAMQRREERKAANGGTLLSQFDIRINLDFTGFDNLPLPPEEMNSVCYRELVNVASNMNLYCFVDKILLNSIGMARGYHGTLLVGSKKQSFAAFWPGESGVIDKMHLGRMAPHTLNQEDFILSDLINEVGDHFWACYDLGDQYTFKITLLKSRKKASSGTIQSKLTNLVRGAGLPPPEDSNGLPSKGNQGVLELLSKDKKYGKLSQDAHYAQNYRMNLPPTNSGSWRLLKDFDLDHMQCWFLYCQDTTLCPVREGPDLQVRDEFYNCPDCCWFCSSCPEKLNTCSGCGLARYCDANCQKSAWKIHKKYCREKQSEHGSRKPKYKFKNNIV